MVKDKCQKRNNEKLKYDKNNINNNKSNNNNNNINNNKCNFTSCSSSNYFDLTSPKSSKIKFSTSLISLKNDYLPIIDKDMNNIKKKKLVKYDSLSKDNNQIIFFFHFDNFLFIFHITFSYLFLEFFLFVF